MKVKKTCCICGAEYWSERLNSKYCSDECKKIGRKKYFKERYNNNAEKLKEQSREWREKHPEYIKAYADRYRKENPHYDRDRWRKIRGSEKHVFECIVCGKVFETWNPNKITCSDECKRENIRRKHSSRKRRIPKSQLVDKDITLEALYEKEDGICYLCGGKCDWSDIDMEKNRTGLTYPTIEHVIPISKGGLHAWGNVRLAHMWCNAVKRDKSLNEVI